MSSFTLAKFGRFDMFDARSLIYFMRVKLGGAKFNRFDCRRAW